MQNRPKSALIFHNERDHQRERNFYGCQSAKRIEDGVAAASKGIPVILRDIHAAAENSEASREDIMIKRTIASFANLLVKLSVQADKITQENLAMQGKLVRLTWMLAVLTAGLLAVTVSQILYR